MVSAVNDDLLAHLYKRIDNESSSPHSKTSTLKSITITLLPSIYQEDLIMFKLPQISTRNEMRILNWGHIAQISMVLIVIILAFIKIGSGNVRGRSDVWGLSVVSPHFPLSWKTSRLTVVGYQITGLLRVHDRYRKARGIPEMVQPESYYDSQYHRMRLLARPHYNLQHVSQGMFWPRMYP